MYTVKLTLIPYTVTQYFDKFIKEYAETKTNKSRTFIDAVEWIKKRQLDYFIEQITEFEPRLKLSINKGIIEFESNDWTMDMRIIMGDSIMKEVKNIEIVNHELTF